jgi:glycosyltransferase involved in cell wall biosynthesis
MRSHPYSASADPGPRIHPAAQVAPDAASLSVLAVTPEFDNGGTEVQLLELGHGLLRGGGRYRIVTGGGTQLDRLQAAGFAHRVVRRTAGKVPVPLELSAYASAVLRELLTEPTDVVQSTAIRTTYAASLAIFAYAICRPQAQAPALVTTLHGGKQKDLYGRASRHLRWLSDAVIVVSQAGREALLSRGFPADRVSVVPPGRDLDAFLRVADGAVPPATIPGVPPNARVVLTVGRLVPLKGLGDLIDAWKLVTLKTSDAYLVIAGNGELEADLRARAASLGLEQRVIFTGFRTDIPALLARAELFVLSSLWEGLPMAAVEAMAAGRPVVATATGGTAEVVEHGHTGLLVPPRHPHHLAEAIRHVLHDGSLACRLAAEGKQQVRERYTRTALIAATCHVYRKAIAYRISRDSGFQPREA